jgi:plastocyanin
MAENAFRATLLALALLPGSASAREWAVKIEGMQSVPASVSASVGDTVTWENRDIVPHTVTAKGKKPAFDSGVLQPGQTFRAPVKKAGTVRYGCALHPTMSGKIRAR